MERRVNGIAFHDDGILKGPPIVFIHGFPFNHKMWEPQVQALSKTYRTVSYDVRGHGQSDTDDGQYTMELFVDNLLMLLDHLKIERTILCGLSMGGYIALRTVERHAERFNGLILCDTKSETDNNEVKIKRADSVRDVKKDGVWQFANAFVNTVLSEHTFKTKPELVQYVLNLIRGNSPTGICGTLLALAARTDTTASLEKIKMPTLILVGEEDKLTPPSASKSMAKAISRSEMHVIPSAAHLSNLENPVVFNDKLISFLKQNY